MERSSYSEIEIIVMVTVVMILAFIGVLLRHKNHYWSIYKKQYSFLSVGIVVCYLLILFIPIVKGQGSGDVMTLIVIPLLTSLISSIIYGIINLGSDPKFAEAVSKEVTGKLSGTMPSKVYQRVVNEKDASPEFRNNLVDSMLQSNSYNYSGVDMTIASCCIKNSIKRVGYGKKGAIIKDMLFIIPDLNEQTRENDNEAINADIKQRKSDSKGKLIESIRTINMICSKAHYQIKANFYILPQRPTLHIHKTDEMSFWGVVDKVDNCDCPTTYCFKRSDNDPNGTSMYTAISDLIEQTKKRVEKSVIPSKHFEVTWLGDGKEKENITYKDHSNGAHTTCSVKEFVDFMKIEESKKEKYEKDS